MKFVLKIAFLFVLTFSLGSLFSCKKDQVITDASAMLEFSQDSILFDTVFTKIGSATQNFRIRNKHNKIIKISSITLQGGSASAFKINVDGVPGSSWSDLEIAPNDSMYVFVQVNVDPTNSNSPVIISDALMFQVNGNQQKLPLEAWGQDAYYHRPDSAIHFKDGTYFAYSVANAVPNSYTKVGDEFVWKNDKPHVIYNYLVVDEGQKLKIQENTKVYLNYKAGLWVFAGGQLQVLGKKNQEVIFQGARREKDWADEPGQWDRIWINEGSDNNVIDYAIIKNGFIGVQCEFMGEDTTQKKWQLTLTNTKIQNMSKWGLYCLYFKVFAGNTIISNCQEHSVNIALGGAYSFIHCTFSNFWNKSKPREKPTLNLNNYSTSQIVPLNAYFGNCIIDGKLSNEVNIDIKDDPLYKPVYSFSNSWLKTTNDVSTANYINVRADKNTSLNYKDVDKYDFEPLSSENRVKGFVHANATADALKFPLDLNAISRNTTSISVGAIEVK
ncbi:MAG: hypothetical protein PSX36_00590 [bacterium]|nr:hypothetical protein [bacterium]